jgi:hypothetical protein
MHWQAWHARSNKNLMRRREARRRWISLFSLFFICVATFLVLCFAVVPFENILFNGEVVSKETRLFFVNSFLSNSIEVQNPCGQLYIFYFSKPPPLMLEKPKIWKEQISVRPNQVISWSRHLLE